MPHPIALVFVLCAALTLLVPAARATTYKWIDDQGVVHYTDKIPTDQVDKGNVELNKQGIAIKKTDPALTPEQRRAKAAEEERLRLDAKARDELARKDRALLQTYTTESEIDLVKKRALATIEGQLQSAQAYSNSLGKRKQEIASRIAALSGKPIPAALDRELSNVNEELDRQSELIATKRKELVVVTARYDADKQRWQELAASMTTEANNAPPASATTPRPGTVPTSNKK